MRNTTMTVRMDAALREALDRRAEAEGKPLSEVVREILERALEERPIGERVARLRGRLRIAPTDVAWRERLRERNWRS